MKKLLYIIIGFLCAGQSAKTQTTKPNIVWITIEDTSPDFIGCYGNRQVKTPNIDALATEGVRFTHAYSTNVVCSPSRHTIITGVRTAVDGCGNHRSQFKVPSDVKGFASYLKNAGYFTSNNAKTDYNLANARNFIQNNWTEQGGKADFTKRKSKDQSFFSIFNFNESHQSRTVGNSTAWYEKEILGRLKKEEIIKAEGLDVPPFYKQNDNNRENIARLYNCLRVTDNEVGRIVKMLKDNGDWDNTIVFFYADHGQGMPRFKTNASRLGHQVPFVVRFPEKWQHLAPAKKGETIDELVTFEDLAPTILSLVGITKPDYMKGRIFLGAQKEITDNIFWGCRDNTDEVIDMGRTLIKGDYVYERIYYSHHPVLQQQAYWNRSPMLIQMRNDYQNKALNTLEASIFTPRTAEYLFNRKTDKWETLNLAHDKQYEKILLEMRQINQEHIIKHQDLGFLPENVLAQIDQTQTVGEWKVKNYDVKKYLDVAEMVGMSKAHLTKQMNLLTDKDSVVRYWAVIGLRNQNSKDLNKKQLLKVYQNEQSEMVKIELADLFLHLFKDKTQLQYLVNTIIQTSNGYAARQASMRLANYPDLPENIVEQIRKMRKELAERHKGVGYSFTASLSTIIKAKVEDDSN